MKKRVFYALVGLALFTTFAFVLTLGGCEDEKSKNTRVEGLDARSVPGNVDLDANGNPKPQRDLAPLELDTLRAQKKRFNITREEYWDDKGGVLANDYLELWYPVGKLTVTHGMYAFSLIDRARKSFRNVFGRVPEDRLTVVCSASLQEYDKLVGQEWWQYSRIQNDKITYQPIPVLYQRRLSEVAVPREYYEWALGKISGGRAPRWLEEGMASVLADEGFYLKNQLKEYPDDPVKMDMKKIESVLNKENVRKDCRLAYYNTFRMVEKMEADYGREKVVGALLLMGDGDDVKTAFEKSFQEPYDDVIKKAMEFTVQR